MTIGHRVHRTKISVPTNGPKTVRRGRLFDRLEACLVRPLTVISAPAGYGKTMFVADWASATIDRRVSWVSLDEDDRDASRFLRHVVAALRVHDAALAEDVLALLDSSVKPDNSDLLTYLIEDLARWGERLVLVFDDYHLARSDLLDLAMNDLSKAMPENLRVVILTREDPTPAWASARAHGLLSEVGAAELQFVPHETADFFVNCMDLELSELEVRGLQELTEGWIAALQMAALSLRHGAKAEPLRQFTGRHPFVIDFVGAEVLRSQPKLVRSFLQQTAILGRMCASLCDAVTGRSDSQEMISRLVHANMFIVSLDAENRWFRYHRLFADLLRVELSEQETFGLNRRAASWYESHDQPFEALKHAIAGRDAEACVRFFRASFGDAVNRGEIRNVLNRLSSLPDEVVKANADLSIYKAWMLFLVGSTDEARCFAAIGGAQVDDRSSSDTRALASTFNAYVSLNWGNPAIAAEAARTALTELKEKSEALRVIATSYLGQAQSLLAKRTDAVATLRQALYLGEAAGDHAKSLDALWHLTPLLRDQGRILEGIVLCEKAIDRYCDSRGKALPVGGLAFVSLGLLQFEQHDIAAARKSVEKGSNLCSDLGMVYHLLGAQRILAKLQWHAGEKTEALYTLARSRELVQRSGGPRRARIAETTAVELLLLGGDAKSACAILGDADIWADTETEELAILRARALLLSHRPEAALMLLDRLEAAAKRDGFEGSRVSICVLQARSWLLCGNRSAARRVLERAIMLAAPSSYRRIFVDEGAPLLALVAELRHLAPDFVDGLLSSSEAGAIAARPEVTVLEPLSQKDIQVLSLMNRGLRNQEIAEELSITVGTTKQYVNRLFSKLGARNRIEAVTKGRQLHLLP